MRFLFIINSIRYSHSCIYHPWWSTSLSLSLFQWWPASSIPFYLCKSIVTILTRFLLIMPGIIYYSWPRPPVGIIHSLTTQKMVPPIICHLSFVMKGINGPRDNLLSRDAKESLYLATIWSDVASNSPSFHPSTATLCIAFSSRPSDPSNILLRAAIVYPSFLSPYISTYHSLSLSLTFCAWPHLCNTSAIIIIFNTSGEMSSHNCMN